MRLCKIAHKLQLNLLLISVWDVHCGATLVGRVRSVGAGVYRPGFKGRAMAAATVTSVKSPVGSSSHHGDVRKYHCLIEGN